MLKDIEQTKPEHRILKITRTIYIAAEDANAERAAFYAYWFDEHSPAMMTGGETIEEGTIQSFDMADFMEADDEPAVLALDMAKLFPAAGAVDTWPETLPADVVRDVLSELGRQAPEADA